jgi:hypothetical protein
MRDEIRKLRAQMAKLPRERAKRFTATARQEIARLGRQMRDQGASWREIGTALGVHVESVRRFCRQPGFAAVEVVEAESMVVVVSPSGFRIEGLTLAEVAELVGRLR